ncbi:MAG: Sec-independent protein translocase protein TatB [Massilia sp.]
MIDLGLSKLAIIGVVALVVIGPEKLPKVARMAGTLYGRAQRYLSDVKSEVSREIELDELRNLHKEMTESAQSIREDVENTVASTAGEVEAAWRGDSYSAPPPPPATATDIERKARDFRRKKLVRTSSIPAWYKQRAGVKNHVLSGAARVRKFRPGVKSNTSFF